MHNLEDFSVPIGIGLLLITITSLILFANLDFYKGDIKEVQGVVVEKYYNTNYISKQAGVYVDFNYDGKEYKHKRLELSVREAETLQEGDNIKFQFNLDTKEIRPSSYNIIPFAVMGYINAFLVMIFGIFIKIKERKNNDMQLS